MAISAFVKRRERTPHRTFSDYSAIETFPPGVPFMARGEGRNLIRTSVFFSAIGGKQQMENAKVDLFWEESISE